MILEPEIQYPYAADRCAPNSVIEAHSKCYEKQS